MRRYLSDMRPVPVGRFGHAIRAIDIRFDPFRRCETPHCYHTAVYCASWREEHGRRRSSIRTTDRWLCESCGRDFAATRSLTLPVVRPEPIRLRSGRIVTFSPIDGDPMNGFRASWSHADMTDAERAEFDAVLARRAGGA